MAQCPSRLSFHSSLWNLLQAAAAGFCRIAFLAACRDSHGLPWPRNTNLAFLSSHSAQPSTLHRLPLTSSSAASSQQLKTPSGRGQGERHLLAGVQNVSSFCVEALSECRPSSGLPMLQTGSPAIKWRIRHMHGRSKKCGRSRAQRRCVYPVARDDPPVRHGLAAVLLSVTAMRLRSRGSRLDGRIDCHPQWKLLRDNALIVAQRGVVELGGKALGCHNEYGAGRAWSMVDMSGGADADRPSAQMVEQALICCTSVPAVDRC